LIEADIIKVKSMGEVCLGDGNAEVKRVESADGGGLEGVTSVSSKPVNVEIAIEGPILPTIMTRKRHSSGECRVIPSTGSEYDSS